MTSISDRERGSTQGPRGGGTLRGLRLLALGLAILSSALAAGFFFAFDCCVMPAFGRTDPAVAIRAMQAINANVRNPVFAFAFFGPLVFGAAAALTYLRHPLRGALAFAGLGLYALGVLAVTFSQNVPLNDALAALQGEGLTARRWIEYAAPWMSWNMVRTLSSCLALYAFVLAVLREVAATAARRP